MPLNRATSGFQNLGQFLAAAHVSKNLGISFTALKKQVTGPHAISLGQAIHKLDPSANAAAEVKTARAETHTDLESLKDWRDERPHHAKDAWNQSGPGRNDHVAHEITRNPALASTVRSLLPAGTSLRTAAAGFRSEKQFLEALHASKNLHVSFRRLKSELTGHDHDSLTEAIREIAPTVDANAAAKLAASQAKSDLKSATTKVETDHDGSDLR